MGLSGQTGKGSSDNTTTNDGTYDSYGMGGQGQMGGQSQAGGNTGYTGINYLDPASIAKQQARYDESLGTGNKNTNAAWDSAYDLYGGLLSSPGYDEGTKTAMSAIGNSAANEKLAEAKANAERHAAATGNDAGYTAGMSNVFGSAARDSADRANQNVIQFYNEQQRQKELGGAGMERLYGTAQGAQLGLMGGANQLSTLASGTTSGNENYGNSQNYNLGLSGQTGGGSNASQQHALGSWANQGTGGSADAANGLGSLTGGLGDILKGLFGKGASSSGGGGQPAGAGPGGGYKKQPDGSYVWTNPDTGYGGLPYGQQNPGFTGQGGYFDEFGNWNQDGGNGTDTNNDGMIDGYDFNGGTPDPAWDPYGYEGAPDPGSIDWGNQEDPYYNDPWGDNFDPYGGLDNWGGWD